MQSSIFSVLALVVVVLAIVLGLVGVLVTTFLRGVDAGEILLVNWWKAGGLRIFRGPTKALVIPFFTQNRSIPAQAINVDIEITDQTADIDTNGRPAPVKVTVRASAIVSVGEDDSMVNTGANKFFSKPPMEQMSTLTDVLSSAGRRAINLLRHDQLFNARAATSVAAPSAALVANTPSAGSLVARGDDDELAVIIKEACSRELLDLGLTFNSLNIKAVLSEVADARRRESAARAKASADVVQAQEQQRSRIAELEAQQKVNDQEKALNMQIASNGASVARAEADRQTAVREQRMAELAASQITQAQADADQNVIKQEAEGRAQAARIKAVAEAEAEAIRMKSQALMESGGAYLDLRRLEMAPELTRQVSLALANGQFVNFGTSGEGGHSAVSSGSDDVMRVVQTLMAAQVITGGGASAVVQAGARNGQPAIEAPPTPATVPSVATSRPVVTTPAMPPRR